VTIGVLALQGDFAEHASATPARGGGAWCDAAQFDGLSADPAGNRRPSQPATTFADQPLRAFAKEHAVWGTCAGAIFLSRDAGRDQPLLDLMDIRVERNAFGRQVDSFETALRFPMLGEPQVPFPCVFIRAPLIESAGAGVEVLARLDEAPRPGGGTIVAARQGKWLATSFHPELTPDLRFHSYFAEMAGD
jgi:5'-phosphate synthase pdxT subunit